MAAESLKILLIIGDGMADRPINELNHKTPLEVANTPNMDEIARQGITGIMDVLDPGIPPGSAPAHLAILGYDPYKNYTGRGAFEALGIGLILSDGDVAFRCNFATVDDDLVVVDRRAGRYVNEGDELAEALNGLKLSSAPDVEVIFKHSIEHRAVLVFRGKNLSRMVTSTDPGKTGLKVLKAKPLTNDESSIRTAKALNEFTMKSHEILRNHPANKLRVSRGLLPANIILSRGAGTLPKVQSIEKKFRIRSACIAGVALIKGVCKALGFEVLNVPGATGGLDSNLRAKAKAAIEAIEKYDFVLVSVKGTDAASHDGLLEEKIRMIEKVDEMVGVILDRIDLESVCIAITADHATPISVRNHVGDPVPVAISSPTVIPDDVSSFSERASLRGGLGRIRGINLMPIMLNYSLRCKKFGE
ncbi:MAG: 2,3-bisphosphoglycerate-independent phosphoglycerate mutase [Candidatus Methanomethylicota archaeon]|uniref:2,3-bisphosphoglycerate-independent phosphoglycerate mutase n=1 Tax=Thermoproteota archaeon TaxID=2056631 RepID=A0A497F1X2_9CREN|nr:MAG: 2,3-bisphosphoglycerate-independent phosphoglycerate mutase [Candidatus Verstraetearchaeota archaeon]